MTNSDRVTGEETLARLYVGNAEINRGAAARQVRLLFEGFTTILADGEWRGEQEKAIIFEVALEFEDQRADIRKLASRIAELCGEECVLVTFTPVEFELVYRRPKAVKMEPVSYPKSSQVVCGCSMCVEYREKYGQGLTL